MGMSNLTDVVILTDHYSSRSGRTIDTITIHHMAGNLSVETCGQVFRNVEASANYGIGTDGRVGCYVEEENRAWSTTDYDNDSRAINIEVANDEIGGNWHVSDTALNKCIDLCVDICKRYGFKLSYDGTPGCHLTTHNMFMATTCPGPYLESKMSYIVEQVNKKLGSNFKARGHIQDIGWTDWKNSGEVVGTTGENKRLEALQIDAPFEVEAKAHIQDIGWVDYGIINKDTIIGTTGKAKRIDCLCFKGNFKYKVHIQDTGWTCWTDADGICTLGSVGQRLQIEAIIFKPL